MNFDEKLAELKGILDKRLELFFAKVNARDSFIDLAYKVLASYMQNGGKRLRPAALVMAYKGFGGLNDGIYDVALSVEFMHNSTLVHDDIMDEDSTRRNKPTIHELMRKYFLKLNDEQNYEGALFNKLSSRFAATNAICCGNILLSLGSLFITSSGFDPVSVQKALKFYSSSYMSVNQGQIMDAVFETESNIKEEGYLAMVNQKTGELFKASVAIGALLAGASGKEIEIMSDYAVSIAAAFQMQDDMMDISEDMDKGHKIGSDIKKGKKTLLIIRALKLAKKEDKSFLSSLIKNKNATDGDVKKAVSIIKVCGALDYCRKLAHEKADEAKKHLEKLRLSQESHDFFTGLSDFVVSRTA